MPIIPSKKKQLAQSGDQEAEALQKLVSAVLEGTGTNQLQQKQQRVRPRGGLLRRVRTVKAALERRILRNPSFSIVFLCLTICATLYFSTSLVSEASGPENQRAPFRRGGAARLSDGPAGPSYTAPSTSAPSAPIPVPRVTRGQVDITKDLVKRVAEGRYERPEDVATGRFLRDFPEQWLLLSDVDLVQIQPIRRGKRMVQLIGPYRSTELDESHRGFLSDDQRPSRTKQASEAIIRMVKVKVDGHEHRRVWKLEHIRVN